MLPSTAMTDMLLPATFHRALRVTVIGCMLAACGAPATGPVPSPHTAGPSGLIVSPSSLSMSPGDSATVDAGEQGYNGSFSQSNDCSGIVTVTKHDAGSYGVAAVAPGTCKITVSDTNGHSVDVSVSVQTIIVGGQ